MRHLVLLIVALLMPACGAAVSAQVIVPELPPIVAPITVCTVNCTYDNAHLQNALDAAKRWGTVLLESGWTYTAPDGGFVLGTNCQSAPAWNCVTVRTGVTATGAIMAASNFPSVGARMTTGYRGVLATLVPSVNNSPALRTVYPGECAAYTAVLPCRGDGWTVQWLEFAPKVTYAQRALVQLGTNKAGREWNGSCGSWPDPNPSCWNTTLPNAQTQDTLNEVPQYLSFIQNDLHGDSFVGQHQGLLLATKDVRVLSNSFTDIKSLSETQAITGINGIGPYDVENNEIDATGENSMWGGGDPYLFGQATIAASPTPTTTLIALSLPVWYSRIDTVTTAAASLVDVIYSGIYVGITHAGTTYGGMTCTLKGLLCTLSPAMPVTPSAGDIVQWDWFHGGVTFKYNYARKPMEWFGNVLATPTGVTATAIAGGTLTAATYCYRVMWFAYVSGAEGSDVQSAPSTEVCAVVNGTTNQSVRIDWPGDSHATRYWVYGRASGAQTMSWQIAAGTVTYTDTGSAGTANTPLEVGHNWTVKNAHEWKGCDGAGLQGPCLIQGNIIERSWCCTQSNAISIKVNNQDGLDYSSTVRNFTFRDNWIRHMQRALSLSTSEGGSSNGPSGFMVDVTVTNNLFTDLASTWVYPPGGDSHESALIVASGAYANIAGDNRGCVRCTVTHNTFLASSNDMKGPIWFNLQYATDKMTDFILRDNIMARDCITAGCISDANGSLKGFNPSNVGQGTAAWNAVVQGSSVADHNAWPEGSSGTYTAGPFTTPFFITDALIKSTHLANYTNCNTDADILGCALVGGSSMHNAASDGTDVGANVSTIKAFTDSALTGGLIPTTFKIEAEEYDLGGEGVAYHDTVAGNQGDAHHRTDDVDLEVCGDTLGGYDIGFVFATEWLKYTRIVPGTGTYTLAVRVASNGSGGTFHVEVDGVDVTGTLTVPNTMDWQIYTTVTKTGVALTAGSHVFTLAMDSTGGSGNVGNFNWITATPH